MTRKAKRFIKRLMALGYSRNEAATLRDYAINSIFTYDLVLHAAKPVTKLARTFIKYYKHQERYFYLNEFGLMDADRWEKLIAYYDPIKIMQARFTGMQHVIFRRVLFLSDKELNEFRGIKPAVLIKFKHEFVQRMKGLEGVKILETESEIFYQEINGIRVCKK